MRSHPGPSLGRLRFLALPAGGAAAMSGCALQVSSGVSGDGDGDGDGDGETVTSAGTPVSNLQAAASVSYVVPLLLVFLVAQRGFVTGVSTTGLK